MLSGNPNRLHLPIMNPLSYFLKNITYLLGMILLLGTHAAKGLLLYVL